VEQLDDLERPSIDVLRATANRQGACHPGQDGLAAASAPPCLAKWPIPPRSSASDHHHDRRDQGDIDTLGGQVKRLELLKYKGAGNRAGSAAASACSTGASLTKASKTWCCSTKARTTPIWRNGPDRRSFPYPQERLHREAWRAHAERRQASATGAGSGRRRRQADQDLHLQARRLRDRRAPRRDQRGRGAVTPQLYLQLAHDGNKPVGDSFFNSSFTGPTLYTPQDKYQKLTFEKIEKAAVEDEKKGNDNAEGAHPQRRMAAGSRFRSTSSSRPSYRQKSQARHLHEGRHQPVRHRQRAAAGTLAPGASASMDSKLYSGPQIAHLLEAVSPGLELVKDYGWLTIIAKPIFWVMEHIHSVLGNWGWTIIAFTILIKLAFFPLSAAGYRSMAKMKLVTPKMQAIRERYKGDPQR
jgi:YidC/Oxa1 family membrane protein insertase